MDTERLRIGELSERHGLSTAAVRYYERLGLLGEPERGHNGYRLFTDDDDARLRFILRGKALNLSLEEIRSLLDAWHEGRCQETRVALRHLVAHKIREARERVREAEAFAAQLTHVYERLGEEAVSDSATCGCIPELPVAGPESLQAELAQIEQSVCNCGGRTVDAEGCPCGCCAPIAVSGGGDHMPDALLTERTEQALASTCSCCAPASQVQEPQPVAQVRGCNCGSGSSEGCGPDCSCGSP